jgi:hypothetical protein
MKTGALRTVPDKTDKEGFSHVADDLQYLLLLCMAILCLRLARRLRPRTKRAGSRVSAAGWT